MRTEKALSPVEQAIANLSPAKRLIVRALSERGELSRKQIAEVIGYAKPESARPHLSALIDAGVIESWRADKRPLGQRMGLTPMMYRMAKHKAGWSHAR